MRLFIGSVAFVVLIVGVILFVLGQTYGAIASTLAEDAQWHAGIGNQTAVAGAWVATMGGLGNLCLNCLNMLSRKSGE